MHDKETDYQQFIEEFAILMCELFEDFPSVLESFANKAYERINTN